MTRNLYQLDYLNVEYNVKETLEIAEKIENINPDLFEYPVQKQELINILPERD